jgi:hypothetical protein
MNRGFQVDTRDNVATLLQDADGAVDILGPAPQQIALREPIAGSHKVALVEIAAGAPIVKFGVRIGHATQAIRRGAWVHLHNMASDLDERSGTLDLHSGAPTDTRYE